MTPNVGSVDKTLRLVLGAILLALAFLQFGIASFWGILTLIVGAVLIVTALINFCPLFKLLGINSIKDTYSN